MISDRRYRGRPCRYVLRCLGSRQTTERNPRRPGLTTADERALLKLLAAGLTDEAVARRLGRSVRTTRSQVAALMVKLGASSRFQAGHKAAERGWL